MRIFCEIRPCKCEVIPLGYECARTERFEIYRARARAYETRTRHRALKTVCKCARGAHCTLIAKIACLSERGARCACVCVCVCVRIAISRLSCECRLNRALRMDTNGKRVSQLSYNSRKSRINEPKNMLFKQLNRVKRYCTASDTICIVHPFSTNH